MLDLITRTVEYTISLTSASFKIEIRRQRHENISKNKKTTVFPIFIVSYYRYWIFVIHFCCFNRIGLRNIFARSTLMTAGRKFNLAFERVLFFKTRLIYAEIFIISKIVISSTKNTE